jgi:hypothetical protein
MTLEDELQATLTDDRLALPGWPDPAGRVRAGMARRRRNRAVAVVTGLVAAGVAVALPVAAIGGGTRPDGPRPLGPVPVPVPWVSAPGVVATYPTPPPGQSQPAVSVPPRYYQALHASITAPARAKFGSTIEYVVTLTNPTDRPVTLDPCPVYVEGIWTSVETHPLNCAPGSIPAGGSVEFGMRIQVPGQGPNFPDPDGVAHLSWAIAESGELDATASADIAVSVDGSARLPDPCAGVPTSTACPTAGHT